MTVDSEQAPQHSTNGTGSSGGNCNNHHHDNENMNGHPPPVIVQETDDEDDVLPTDAEITSTSTGVALLDVDEETLNSGAEGWVVFGSLP